MTTPTLQELATELNDIYSSNGVGNTPLFNIAQNASSPTVQMKLHDLEGLRRLYGRLHSHLSGLSPKTACGSQLDTVAGFMGQSRKINFKSVVPIVFCGASCDSCNIIEGGTKFTDAKGREWETLNNVELKNGYGFVNAASVDNGAFDLQNGELELIDPIKGVHLATNSATPDMGGGEQSDESFRRSLLNLRPHWRVKETGDAVTHALYQLDGVVKAQVIKHPQTCKPMVAVLGGNNEDIAQAIYDNAPFSVNNLTGETLVEVGSCLHVPFQRYCPAIVKLRLWADCKCKTQTQAEALAAIFGKSQSIAINQTNLSAKDILCCQSYFNRVEFQVVRPKLAACKLDSDLITDPATGDDIHFAVYSEDYGNVKGCDSSDCTSSLCSGSACDADFQKSAELCEFQYPIISPDHVEILNDCPDCGDC